MGVRWGVWEFGDGPRVFELRVSGFEYGFRNSFRLCDMGFRV